MAIPGHTDLGVKILWSFVNPEHSRNSVKQTVQLSALVRPVFSQKMTSHQNQIRGYTNCARENVVKAAACGCVHLLIALSKYFMKVSY